MSKDAVLRKLMFVPCDNKEALHRWVRLYLGVSLPSTIVSEESNSCPLDLLWELYDRCRRNDLEGFSRVLYYAARFSGKTFIGSVFEVLCMVHLERDVVHMAATLDQSKKAQEYVKKFLSMPFLKEFVTSDNKTEVFFSKCVENKTGKIFSKEEAASLPSSSYTIQTNYIRIIAATMKATNGQHASVFFMDEVDLVQDRRALDESKMIPTSVGEKLPITILTSTRKFAIGNVQEEIDAAPSTGLHIRHWNVLDAGRQCEPSRHLPELPTTTLYVNDDDLAVKNEEEFFVLRDQEKEKYQPVRDTYAGCAKCPIFSVCKGALAKKQIPEATISLAIPAIVAAFKSSSADMISAQLMCRKPSTSGMIFPKFSRERNMLTASEMYEKLTGEKPAFELTKEELISFMKKSDLDFYAGLDWGYTHDFAVITGATNGRFLFVFDVISIPQLDMDQKIEALFPLRRINPCFVADSESPAEIASTKKNGFKVKPVNKFPGSVRAGIELLRTVIHPVGAEPYLYLLKGDQWCETLALDISRYHFRIDPRGNVSTEPDDENDDRLDALRYLVLSTFGDKKGAFKFPTKQFDKTSNFAAEQPSHEELSSIFDGLDLPGEEQTSLIFDISGAKKPE